MSNYQHAKDLEGQVLTLIEAIVPSQAQAESAKSIFRRLFHEWANEFYVGEVGQGSKELVGAEESEALATITISSPGKMTKEKRKEVSEWLAMHSKDLVKLGGHYTDDVFTGRFMR